MIQVSKDLIIKGGLILVSQNTAIAQTFDDFSRSWTLRTVNSFVRGACTKFRTFHRRSGRNLMFNWKRTMFRSCKFGNKYEGHIFTE